MREAGELVIYEQGIKNVTFLEGEASALPLPEGAVDMVLAITAPLDVDEALRVVRRPGVLIQVDVAPGWYGGELASIIQHPTPELEIASRLLTEQHGFAAEDFESLQDYGTQDHLLRTYGFIFGPRAIAHIKQTGQTTIRWRFRIHSRWV